MTEYGVDFSISHFWSTHLVGGCSFYMSNITCFSYFFKKKIFPLQFHIHGKIMEIYILHTFITFKKHCIYQHFKPFYLSRLFIVGNNKTSRIAIEFVIIITIRSIPNPIPPVGGIPILRAFKKSSSV